MTVRPLTQDGWWQLTGKMALDSHSCHVPTHVIYDDSGEIAGAFSVACAPVLFFWMESKRRNALGAAHAYALAEEEFRRLGHDHIILYLEKDSPFYPYLERVGYERLGEVTAFTKALQINPASH